MMIEVQTELAELFEGETAGGRIFWHEKGSNTVLCQEWNHRASGRVGEMVEAYTTTYDDLGQYIVAAWPEYRIVKVSEVQGL